MLRANGIERTTADWAQRLGVSTFAITHALAEGLTMQEVVDAYQADTFAAPSTPPPQPQTPPNPPAAHAGPLLQTPGGSFTFRTLCAQCADQAKNYYDLAHTAHKEQQRLEARAQERAQNDLLFEFVNFDASPQRPTQQDQGAHHASHVQGDR